MKYEFTGDTLEYSGKILNRIRSLIDIPEYNVKVGDLGGWVEDRFSLSQTEASWVADESKVLDKGRVIGNALIENNSIVKDNGRVQHNAKISNTIVSEDGAVFDNALVKNSRVIGSGRVYENAIVENSLIADESKVFGNSKVTYTSTFGKSSISENAEVYNVIVENKCSILDSAKVSGKERGSNRKRLNVNSIITKTFDDNCFEISFNGGRYRTCSYSGYEMVGNKKIHYIYSLSLYGVYNKTIDEWAKFEPERPDDSEYMRSYYNTIKIVKTIITTLNNGDEFTNYCKQTPKRKAKQ